MSLFLLVMSMSARLRRQALSESSSTNNPQKKFWTLWKTSAGNGNVSVINKR